MPTDPNRDLLISRTCGWCGSVMTYSGSGRPRTYCRKSCRNRAWELRTAEARLGRDLTAGRATAEPVREVISRPPTLPPAPRAPAPPKPLKVPTKTADWIGHLDALGEQLHDGELGNRHWDHGKLMAALLDALTALDEVTPGGLEELRRRRR